MESEQKVPSSNVAPIEFGKAKTRRDIIQRLATYFSLPQNVEARQSRETAEDAARRNIGEAVNNALPDRFDLSAPDWPDQAWGQLKPLLVSARENHVALDGLQIVIAAWLKIQTGHKLWEEGISSIAAQILEGVFRNHLIDNRKQLRGNSGKWHRDTQIIHAIDQLRTNYPDLTLSGNGEPNSVFVIVSDAAKESGIVLFNHNAKKIYDRSDYRQRERWEKINKKLSDGNLAASLAKSDWVNAKK